MTITQVAPSAAPVREVTLGVKNLSVHYETPRGDVIAANRVTFNVCCGEILGLVGESGCGKTTVAMAILQMVQAPGRIVGGEINLDGVNIVGMTDAQLRQVRWRKLSLIPQGAMNSLNPVMKVSEQIQDSIQAHDKEQSPHALKERTLELLNLVGLPARVYDLYPHELSGGMKQRVCIAMAISLNPSIIIADEPTSALDVVVQRVVAQTLMDVKRRLGVSMILIGHDMGLQAQLVDRIAVMYAGSIVEISPVRDIFANPLHPYTQLLIASIPSIKEKKPLHVTEGLTHDLRNPPPGCVFQYRCHQKSDSCLVDRPQLVEVSPDRFVSCYLYPPKAGVNAP
jgi:peptide/nickel transport system ATP-binding protein